MKQHITIEQLNELSDKTRISLNKLWRNDGQEVNLLNHEDINIGQMIEFLEDDWFRYIAVQNKDDLAQFMVAKNDVLCDALWEAVKIVLEDKTTV